MGVYGRALPAERGDAFYLLVGIYVAALGLIGFARNFYLLPFGSTPLAGSAPIYPGVVLHALVFTLWLALAVYQPWQIRAGRIRDHRRVGLWTAWLALALVVTGIYVGGVQATRWLADGKDAGLFALPLVIMLGFALAIGLAIRFRNRPDWHKRWIIVAHAQLLEPASARALSTFELPVFPAILLLISLPLLAGIFKDALFERRWPWIYLLGLLLVQGSGFLRHALARAPGWNEFTNRAFSLFVG
ncbi:hypothetical protein [Arenimonas aestuarii]